MSSTNRGYSRHKSDYYVTPKADVRQFLNKLIDIIPNIDDKSIKWLDPCCGGDAVNDPTYKDVIKQLFNPESVIGLDIREDSKADLIEDYFFYNANSPNIIISNPPFYLAEEFINKSLNDVSSGGYVIMLLRLNFFGSKKRKSLFELTMPKYCFIHHKRISFMNGATDSIEYAHFVWKKGDYKEYCKAYVI